MDTIFVDFARLELDYYHQKVNTVFPLISAPGAH